MAEHFGFNIDEAYKGQFEDLVMGVDPHYHKAIACGLSFLCQDYGDKASHMVDEWFTAIYATVMEMEGVINDMRKYYHNIVECTCAIADNQHSLFEDFDITEKEN